MTKTLSSIHETNHSDCRDLFRNAYENRYTWEPDFPGYQGDCSWTDGSKTEIGSFAVGSNLKVSVNNINDPNISNFISKQLWEVAIHRVRRSFEEVHGENIFTAGQQTPEGLEVFVSGKNAGDQYKIRDNIVTMVKRNIHGMLIKINTKSVFNTPKGYLSKEYSSQYFDTQTEEPKDTTSFFTDHFVDLFDGGLWVLSERKIFKEIAGSGNASCEIYSFSNLRKL